MHRGTQKALKGGRTSLAYAMSGGVALLVGMMWLHAIAGPLEFTEEGGSLAQFGRTHRSILIAVFALLVAGLGVKAALVPLHAWLPLAMVAPAPVSALLHAVAVVKAGAFGIVRVVYDVYGVRIAHDLGVSRRCCRGGRHDRVRLAARGVPGRPQAAARVLDRQPGLVHRPGRGDGRHDVDHRRHRAPRPPGLMKITLFFCAGNLAEELHVHAVSEMHGVGRRMPLTMGAFTSPRSG